MDEPYNGWKNFPTWAAFTHISNDKWLYNEARQAPDAHELSLWAWDNLVEPYIEYGGFVADLFKFSFDAVDWRRILEVLQQD